MLHDSTNVQIISWNDTPVHPFILCCHRDKTQHHLPAQEAEVLLVSGLRRLPHDGLESLAIQSPDVRLGHSWMREASFIRKVMRFGEWLIICCMKWVFVLVIALATLTYANIFKNKLKTHLFSLAFSFD